MIPSISSEDARADWRFKVADLDQRLEAFAPGARSLGMEGDLTSTLWRAYFESGWLYLDNQIGPPVRYVELPLATTMISLSFDATNQPHIGYVAGGIGFWRYWDTINNNYSTMNLGQLGSVMTAADVYTTVDQANRDVWVCYVRGTQLLGRIQRDRYGVEYVIAEGLTAGSRLQQLGPNNGNRMQWRCSK